MLNRLKVTINTILAPRLKRSYFPYLPLFIGLVVTIVATIYVSRQIEEKDKLRFENQINRTVTSIKGNLDTYIALLRAGSGLFAAQNDVTYEEFEEFFQKVELRKYYPGVQGIGFSLKVPEGNQDTLVQMMRSQGIVDFTMYPQPVHEDTHAIIYLQPLDERNKRALGYDMYSDPVRRAAMTRAALTSQPTMSGKVTLVQEIDEKKQAGFLIYLPVYSDGNIPDTEEERRESLIGYVYSPFRSEDFLNAIINRSINPLIEYEVYDGERIDENSLLYDSNPFEIENVPGSHYQSTRKISLANHTWTIVFTSTPAFNAASEKYVVPLVFFGGLIITTILFMLTYYHYSAQRYKVELLEGITDGFLSVNERWQFTYANNKGAHILGKEPEEVLGNNFWKEVPELAKTEYKDMCRKLMKDRQQRRFEIHFPLMNTWYAIRVYPSQSGLSFFFQDITDRKKLEERKDEFLGIASHELKTPLTSIKGYVQILERMVRDDGKPKLKTYIQKIHIYTERLNDLISDLLDVSKIKAGKLELHKSEFTAKSLINASIESVEHLSNNYEITCTGDLNASITGDKDRLEQVLVNLLSNAIKYSPKAKEILIHVKKNRDDIVISVKDFGIGISKRDEEKIFERFYRSDSNPSSISGLGIGLYISSEIVKQHKGRLWLESKIGKGSTFYFLIPLEK